MIDEELICPVCRAPLFAEGNSLYCRGARKHCFDRASSGYVNLSVGRKTGGDPKAAVASRRDFLSLGYYRRIAETVLSCVRAEPADVIVDAGCGEGYYTNIVAASTQARTYGFDLSKAAIDAAAKAAKREGLLRTLYAVAGIYDLPVADASADVVMNLFAPCAEEEFSRILKPGGRLIVVAAGREHLLGLKKSVYDTVTENEARADLPRRMTCETTLACRYDITLPTPEAIRALFAMTPYSYRTSERDYQKLLSLTSLETPVDVEISVYRNEGTQQ